MLVLPRMEMVFTIILARRVVDLGTRRGVAGNRRRTCIAVRAITEGLGMVSVSRGTHVPFQSLHELLREFSRSRTV